MIFDYSTGTEQWVIVYNDDETIETTFDADNVDANAVQNEFLSSHVAVYDRDDSTIQDFRLYGGTITVDSSSHEITQFNANSAPTPETIIPLYVHITMSGGDGEDPIGILNDGTDNCTVHTEIRDGEDPSNSNIVTGINETWRVNLRKWDNHEVLDIVKIKFTNGVSDFQYHTTPNAICGVYYIDPDDIYEVIELGGQKYSFNLINQEYAGTDCPWPCFKVYRDFTS